MGLSQRPSQRDHFSKNSLFANIWIKERISFRKWKNIFSALDYDIDFLEKQLKFNSRKYWTPFQHVSVDEGMIPYKGRYYFR